VIIFNKILFLRLKKVNFKVANTELYPRISCQLVLDLLGCAEHTLGTTALNIVLELNVPSAHHL